MIQATPLALVAVEEDRLAWSESPQGNFDLKSAYKMAMGDDLTLSFSVNWIWKLDILPRIQTFVWTCAHNSISVRDCFRRRGLMEDAKCPLCNRGAKSILHALLDCEKIKPVWNHLGILWTDPCFWSRNLHEWLECNGQATDTHNTGKPPWSVIFLFAIWTIWKSRKKFVFKGKSPNPALAKDIKKQAVEYFFYAYSPKSAAHLTLKAYQMGKTTKWMDKNEY